MHFAAILNRLSSTLRTTDETWLGELIVAEFEAAGHTIDVQFCDPEEMQGKLHDAASDDSVEAVLAGGGDGTISAAAAMLAERKKPLAVLPGGNMNFFARALHIPLQLEPAVKALARGTVANVDIAFADDRPFLHELSVGLRVIVTEQRETLNYGSKFGKMMATLRAAIAVVAHPPRIRLWLETGKGRGRPIVTPALAVSNNVFGEGHLPYPDKIDDGVLGVYVAKTLSPARLALLASEIAAGRWKASADLTHFTARKLRLTRTRPIKALLDGEIVEFGRSVTIRIEAGALAVIRPLAEDAAPAQ